MSDCGFCERTAQVAIREPDNSISGFSWVHSAILVLMLRLWGGRGQGLQDGEDGRWDGEDPRNTGEGNTDLPLHPGQQRGGHI